MSTIAFRLRSCLGSIPLALEPFSERLAVSPDRLRLLTHSALRRLLVCPPPLHLAENAFALHLFLQYPQCRIYVIVAHEHLHQRRSFCYVSQVTKGAARASTAPEPGCFEL